MGLTIKGKLVIYLAESGLENERTNERKRASADELTKGRENNG